MAGPSNTGSTREEFIARVRAALGRNGPTALTQPAPAVDPAVTRTVDPSADLLDLFKQRAAEAGMQVRPTTADRVVATVRNILGEIGARRIVVSVNRAACASGLAGSVQNAGMDVLDVTSGKGLDAQFDLDAGVSDVHLAVAETGSLICATDATHSRGPSLVPPVHVAIVKKSDIVADLIDVWEKIADPGKLPASVAIITGPSKTADIEGILVTGVHGPGKVFVVVVEDE